MTPVKFQFLEPDGSPMALVSFEIRMAKSGFLEAADGIVMPDTLQYTTDEEGTVTVPLVPSSSLYYLKLVKEDDGTDCCAPGIFYKFYVPIVDEGVTVRVQDLIMDPPPSTTAWDEAAMLLIMEAKISSKASADAAKASELAAAQHEDTSSEAAAAAQVSQEAAAGSATAANNDMLLTRGYRDESLIAQQATRASELAAAASAEFAAGAVTDMQEQVDEATRQAGLAGASASAAANSASSAQDNAALTAADVVTTADNVEVTEDNKQATAADVVAVTTLKGDVSDLKDETKGYRDEALAALGTITGVITDGGQIDLSGNAYPPKPSNSTVWRVTTGGVVDGVDFAVGDQLFYTKDQDYFYKQDGTENVHSVAGKKGDVVLVKSDVGLGAVDNTSDLNKPVSTAQQAQFDLRTPTANSLDTTAGRIVRVGDYGRNGGAPVPRIVTDDANALTVGALYIFSNGGVNVPEAAYVDHMPGNATGYAKQIAYGLLTDKQYVRTQNAGVWGNWTSAVEIIDALTSTDPNKALSAKQGKVLYDLLLANNATIVRYTYNLVTGATIITGADSTGKTLSYVPGTPMIVDKDGFSLRLTNDYTASNGTSLVLATATEQDCQINITVFGSFTVADHYTKNETDVLLQNVASQAAEAVGTVKWVPSRQMIPNGAFPLDGGLYSRTTYPDMWALIRDGKVPKVTDALWNSTVTNRGSFTEGDGSTNFRVPDYNAKVSGTPAAVFQRGDGQNAAAAGIIQVDDFKSHTHTQVIGGPLSTAVTQGGSAVVGTTNTSSVTAVGGTETRPYNIAGVWTIRLFGSVSNVGNIDVAQLASNLSAVDNRLTVAEGKQNIYAYAQIARDQINPGEGNIIAWSVDADKMFRKGINYTVGSRAFTVQTAGLYEMVFESLSQSTNGGATDVSMITTTPTSVTRQRRAYTYTPAGQNVSFGTRWALRLGVGDVVYLNITRGTLFNPDATDGSAFTSFSLKRIDD